MNFKILKYTNVYSTTGNYLKIHRELHRTQLKQTI